MGYLSKSILQIGIAHHRAQEVNFEKAEITLTNKESYHMPKNKWM